jgi:lipopolysaccharide export system protein LptA
MTGDGERAAVSQMVAIGGGERRATGDRCRYKRKGTRLAVHAAGAE